MFRVVNGAVEWIEHSSVVGFTFFLWVGLVIISGVFSAAGFAPGLESSGSVTVLVELGFGFFGIAAIAELHISTTYTSVSVHVNTFILSVTVFYEVDQNGTDLSLGD